MTLEEAGSYQYLSQTPRRQLCGLQQRENKLRNPFSEFTWTEVSRAERLNANRGLHTRQPFAGEYSITSFIPWGILLDWLPSLTKQGNWDFKRLDPKNIKKWERLLNIHSCAEGNLQACNDSQSIMAKSKRSALTIRIPCIYKDLEPRPSKNIPIKKRRQAGNVA